MRDSILPQAQTQLDELANQMSQALSNQTTNGTTFTAGAQSDTALRRLGVARQQVQLSYTDSSNVQHTITILSLGPGGTVPAQDTPANPNDQVVGVDFSGGVGSVVSPAERRPGKQSAILERRQRFAGCQ